VLYQVTLPYACFGIVVEDGMVVTAAPIGKWMVGKRISIISVWVGRKKGILRQMEREYGT